MLLNSWKQSSSCCTCDHLTWEVSDDGFKIDSLFWVGLIEFINFNEQLLIGIVAHTLEEPVNCRLKQAEVLVLGQFRVRVFDCEVVMFIHELNHNHEIFLLIGVNGMTHSCEVSAGICSAQGLSDASDHSG